MSRGCIEVIRGMIAATDLEISAIHKEIDNLAVDATAKSKQTLQAKLKHLQAKVLEDLEMESRQWVLLGTPPTRKHKSALLLFDYPMLGCCP